MTSIKQEVLNIILDEPSTLDFRIIRFDVEVDSEVREENRLGLTSDKMADL